MSSPLENKPLPRLWHLKHALKAWMESLGKDIYIEETLHIMKDLMAINYKSQAKECLKK